MLHLSGREYTTACYICTCTMSTLCMPAPHCPVATPHSQYVTCTVLLWLTVQWTVWLLSVCPWVHPSVSSSVCPSVCLSFCLSVHLFVLLSVCICWSVFCWSVCVCGTCHSSHNYLLHTKDYFLPKFISM